MKRLLIITTNFPPSTSVGTQRILKICKYLPKFDWTISILTLKKKYFPNVDGPDNIELKDLDGKLKIYRGAKFDLLGYLQKKKAALREKNGQTISNKKGKEEILKSCKSRWQLFKDFITSLFRIPDKEISWLPFAVFQGFRIIKKERIDVIFSSCPPHTMHLISFFLKLLTGKPLVVDFRDPWTCSQWEPLNETFIERLERRFNLLAERWVISKADSVLLVSEELKRNFINYYKDISANKFIVFSNGYDPDIMKLTPLIRARKSSKKLIISHTGYLYKLRDPTPLFYAVSNLIRKQLLKSEQIQIQFVGGISDELIHIRSFASKLHLDNIIEFYPPVSYKESYDIMANSDVLLLLQPGTLLQIPAKVYDYMCFEKTILALGEKNSATERLIKGEFGLFADVNNVDEIESAILLLLKNPGIMQDKIRENRGKFDVSKSIEKLDDIFSLVLTKNNF